MAIITFVVGTFGLYLYHRRKNDEKRRLAKIILLEIENAQEQLKEAKKKVLPNPDDPLPEHLYTLPSDTWSKNRHLFIEDFKPTEWSAINEFYNVCQVFDEAIHHNDSRFADEEKQIRSNVHKVNYAYVMEANPKLLGERDADKRQEIVNDFITKRNSAVALLTTGEYVYAYTPSKHNNTVKGCLENVNTNLSLESVGQKFQNLSKPRKRTLGLF